MPEQTPRDDSGGRSVEPVDLADLRRTSPISSEMGLDRGTPIDRYYIDSFLRENAPLIRGRVLEVADREYTKRYGGRAVTRSDVVHLTGEAPDTTIVADLTDAPEIADATFDSVILTQTLNFIYDVEAAVSEIARITKPDGTVLATMAGVTQVSRYDMDRWGDFWRFTEASARRLFETAFPTGLVEVGSYGNVLAVTAFLQGLAAGELKRSELDVRDERYPLLIAVKATRARA